MRSSKYCYVIIDLEAGVQQPNPRQRTYPPATADAPPVPTGLVSKIVTCSGLGLGELCCWFSCWRCFRCRSSR
jgi:hypothetical protein